MVTKTIDITVKQGILRGEKKEACMIFRGIPYAEAPVGNLRFKAPVKKKEWLGRRDALEFGAQCPQADPTSGFYGKEFYTSADYPLPVQNEDCLYLNVWAPNEPCEGGYPVAFWIHGGAFDHGFSSEMEFDGVQFAQKNTILVTVNYRVGVFGFFASEEARKEDPSRSTGNYGLLDQVMALDWVRENIAAFGGDPDRITVFGQSAGAMSTQALISSPLTQGKIYAAIMQSGGGYNNGLGRTRTMDEAIKTGKKIMKLLDVYGLKEMRKVPAEKFVSILPELYKEVGGLAFSPVLDNYLLTCTTDAAVEHRTVHNIPYMIGVTDDDIMIGTENECRDSAFFKGIVNFAKERQEENDKPVYLYQFSRKLPGDDAGSFHSSELWYVFGTLDRCWRPMTRHDYMLSDQMVKLWTNFMKTGDPALGWKAWHEEDHFIRVFM